MLYIGCPIWSYKEWGGNFFPPHTPQSDFLRIYSRKLTTVEGNTTFYAIPNIETVARWRSETPSTFRFCLKIPRTISHAPQLDATKKETLFFTERMRNLNERLGPMFLQLPPAFGPASLPQLQAFLEFWPADLRLAIEVRHPHFFAKPHTTSLNELLSQHNAARVIMDSRPIRIGTIEEKQVLQARERKPDLPVQISLTTDFTFIRYIGHPRMEVNDPLLDNWAKQMAEWLKQGTTAYTFCHCPFQIYSPLICHALYQKVRSLAPLPPLSWHPERPDSEVEQPRLF